MAVKITTSRNIKIYKMHRYNYKMSYNLVKHQSKGEVCKHTCIYENMCHALWFGTAGK